MPGWYDDGSEEQFQMERKLAKKRKECAYFAAIQPRRNNWSIRVEFKPEDCWIGVFWESDPLTLHIWICILPMIPVHFSCWKHGKEMRHGV